MRIFFTILLSYIIGCFSTAYFVGKLYKKIDIRNYGSGNAGATNVMRVLGKRMGLITFLADFLKGIVATSLGILLMGYNGGLLAAVFVVIGHDWPVFLGFKGGKGVATSVGSLAILNFPAALISSIIGVSVIFISKYVSLGSITLLLSVPVISSLIGRDFNKQFFLTAVVLAVLSVIRHKTNIKRIIDGNENKIGR